MKSIWTETTEFARRNPLPGNRKTDVAVIGAGMAGILTAYELAKHGAHVLVLEADRIGSGQTSFTTAKITSQHHLIYHKLEQTMGPRYARQYKTANELAVEAYRELIRKLNIECHFEEKDAYLYSTVAAEALKREAEAASRLGIDAAFVRESELPFPIKGAVRFKKQASFHPLEFLKAISNGLTIYEKTRVIEVNGHTVVTDRGKVWAKNIVFACHYPFVNIPGFYFMKMYQDRSYVLQLGPVREMKGMYLGIDSNSFSFRSEGEQLLLGYGSHRTGKRQTENPYRVLQREAGRLFPEAKAVRRWSAQDCMTMDSVPYIGRYSAVTPNWYVAAGFNKWGMTSSMASAAIISGQILGRHVPYEEVFSPQRVRVRASGAAFVSHGVESVKDLVAGAAPAAPRCPHMGCKLSWNPYDQAWECPCHGSRFEQNGKISAGPAQESVSFIN